MITVDTTKPAKTDKIAVAARAPLVLIIMKIEPIRRIIAATIETKLWLKDCVIKSTSLVTRDKVSPCEWLSKYLSGTLLILSAMALRRRCENF